MIETCKKEIDQRKEYGIFLPDLSKAFDCIAGELVIAKLYAYGFSIKILNLVNDYLKESKQSVKINNQFNLWMGILFSVP